MPYSNPITQQELGELTLLNPLHPRDGSPNEIYMPQAYFLVPPATQDGPVKWRLFDAAYISTGIIDPNRLGTGAVGDGNLYLADDGTWKAVSSGGAVDRIIAGTNISISPAGGTGDVTINATTLNPDPTGYGSFYSTQNQFLAAIDTPQIVTFNNTYEANDVSLSSNRIYFAKAGTYQFAYVAQIFNSSNDIQHCEFWIKYNGVDFPNSATHITIKARKSSSEPSEQQMKLILSGTAQNDGDYIELYWQGSTTNLQLGYVAPGVDGPVGSPSVIANIIPIGAQGRDSNLNELNDVLIQSKANNDLLVYESSTSLWKNKTISAIFGGTPLVSVPTLAQVTTVGNTTTNAITVGGLTVDTNVLVVDSTNDRVGFGTTSPAYRIDAQGTSVSHAIRSHIGFDIYPVPEPTSLSAVVSAGGSVDTGLHGYYVTFLTALGETRPYQLNGTTTTPGNNTVTLTLPISPDPRVTGRKIYRTKAGSNFNEYRLAIINDNTTTTYVDTAADSTLTLDYRGSYTRANTTSKQITVNSFPAMLLDVNATYFGINAGKSITSGGYATFIGYAAGESQTTGFSNTYIGYIAARLNQTGDNNVAIGDTVAYSATTMNRNVVIGSIAGRYHTGGSANITSMTDSIFIGFRSYGASATPTNTIVIGNQVDSLGNNTVVLGNSSIVTTALRGNVLINTTTDAGFRLDVNGTARVQGNLYLNDVANRYIYGYNNTYIKFYDSLTGGLDIYNLNGTGATRNYGALEVYGNLSTTGSFTMNGNLNLGNGNYLTAQPSHYNRIYPYDSSNANMRFVINHPTLGDFDWEAPLNTVLVRLKRNGNLLIGTTTDAGYKLDVNGTTRLQNTLTVTGAVTLNSTLAVTGEVTLSGAVTARRFVQATNGVPTDNLGNPTVTEMALFQEQFDNKLAFFNIANFTFETFDGTTWTDITSTITDTAKRKLVGGDATDGGFVIPNGTIQYRVTINNAGYVYLNALYSYWSSNGHFTQVHIWKKHNSGSWEQHTNSTVSLQSWPGHMYLPFNTIPWHPGGTLGIHYNQVRIVYTPSWNASFPSNNINISKLQLWGGYPASKRNIYTTNELRAVTFPGDLNVSGGSTIAGSFQANGSSGFSGSASFAGGQFVATTTGSNTRTVYRVNSVNIATVGSNAATYGTNASYFDIYVNGNNDLQLSTNNVRRLIVKGNGNVLIGPTTDAGYKLEVDGAVRFNNGLTINTPVFGSTQNQGSLLVTAQTGDTRNFSVFLGNTGVYNPVSNTNTVAASVVGIRFDWYTENWMISTTRGGGADIKGLLFSRNGVERMVIDSNGNVGIGVTAPAARVEIDGGTSVANTKVQIIKDSASNLFFVPNLGNTGYNTGSTAGGYGILVAQNKQLLIGQHDGSSISFGTAKDIQFYTFTSGTTSAVRMTIKETTGDVGIGTVSPSTKLDVNGVITATGGNSTNWNTAFGWGNHSSAGYVTTGTAQTITGVKSFARTLNIVRTIAATDDVNTVLNQNTLVSSGFILNGATNAPISGNLQYVNIGAYTLASLDNNSTNIYIRKLYSPTNFTTWERLYVESFHPEADKWTTARTITIGSTGKSVDGSAAVSWSLAEIGATPSSRTLTINGTTYDLSADRSWTIATGATALQALTDVNAPIPNNGDILRYNGATNKWENFSGYTGSFTVPTNPPGQQTLEIQNGIIVNVL